MKRQLGFEKKFLGSVLLWTLPGSAAALMLLWHSELSISWRWVATAGLGAFYVLGALVLQARVVRPLQTISNLLASLREEDFSTRASTAIAGDALGEVFLELNTLSRLLQEQRLGALEATALLRTVMAEIDVAVFAFDEKQKLQLTNRAGEKLLGAPSERLLARTAADLNLADYLSSEPARVASAVFPGASGRWSVRRSTFWQGGAPQQLLVVADVSRALREEELLAWQRLVRVLGHEINNSLAPIKSISGSLSELLRRELLPNDWKDDASKGLDVIATRAEALARFMAAYTQLAKLPPPRKRLFQIGPWLQRVISLETRCPIHLQPGLDLQLNGDSDQLEQVLINLLRNAVDAVTQGDGPGYRDTTEPGPAVMIHWTASTTEVEVRVEDSGPGLSSTTNLFVPFFTTKPGGSGIGLVLSRQIVEAHGGTLTVENRVGAKGCAAVVRLPLGQSE